MEKTLKEKNEAKLKSGRERTQKFRNSLYTNEARHSVVREKDRERWKDNYKINVKTQDPQERREKERLKKQKQRAAAKEKKANENRGIVNAVVREELSRAKKTIKNLRRQQTRSIKKKVTEEVATELRNELSNEYASTSSERTPNRSRNSSTKLTVSNTLWGSLTPKTKRRVRQKLSLSVSPGSGLRQSIRSEIGLNLSKPIHAKSDEKCQLAREVEKFFYREDITQLCPDLKKSAKDPNTREKVQLRYRRSCLKVLYSQFTAEVDASCSLASFERYVPFNIVRPNPQELGTCLCAHCLNPELKYRCLIKLSEIINTFPPTLDDNMTDEEFPAFKKQLEELRNTKQHDVTYIEWMKVDVPSTKSNNKAASKVSRKMPVTDKFNKFIDKFIIEVEQYKQHLERVHAQFKAFKAARLAAEDSSKKTATIHIDWSENARVRQIEEARDGYYYEDHISIQAMHTWLGDENNSSVSLSDDTSHGAAAVIASIGPKLEDLVADGVSTINVISDSPVTQFRNKTIFWFMKSFSQNHNVPLKWIYLETGHGKGIPDGVGAVTKRAIQNVLMDNPHKSFYTVNDLIEGGLDERLPTYDVYIHTKDGIEQVSMQIPILVAVTDTFKIHEMFTVLDNHVPALYFKHTSNEENGRVCDVMEGGTKKKVPKVNKVGIETCSKEETVIEQKKQKTFGSDEKISKAKESGQVKIITDHVHEKKGIKDSTKGKAKLQVEKEKQKVKEEIRGGSKKTEKMIENIKVEKANVTKEKNTNQNDNIQENKQNEAVATSVDFVRNDTYNQVDFHNLATADWVLVNYFGTYHIGTVLQISLEHNCAKVRCLNMPYSPSASKPSMLESVFSAVWYEKESIFEPPMIPHEVNMKDVDGTRGYKYVLKKQ